MEIISLYCVCCVPDDKKFEMAVINPAFVMGPPLIEAHKSSTSVSFLVDILNHKNPAVLKFMIGYCDVRDVAKAHVLVSRKAFIMKDFVLFFIFSYRALFIFES